MDTFNCISYLYYKSVKFSFWFSILLIHGVMAHCINIGRSLLEVKLISYCVNVDLVQLYRLL